MAVVLRFFYLLGMTVFVCLLAPFFLFHSRGRQRLLERYGVWGSLPEEIIWLHGASAGEVVGLLQILPKLRERYSGLPVLLTSTSIHGINRGQGLVDHIRLIPFDHPVCIAAALRGNRVRLFCFGETEIWPELLRALGSLNVPVFMLNATISDFTRSRYLRWRKLFSQALKKVRLICAANEQSRQRLLAMGVRTDQIMTTGNSKYDLPPQELSASELEALRAGFGFNEGPVVTLGSVRPQEETFWLQSFAENLTTAGAFNLIMAPRHAEKYEYFVRIAAAQKLSLLRWSEQANWSAGSGARLILLDTMGMLDKAYAISDLAFIGATLVPGIGGHNPLEAAARGCFVSVGPHHNKIQPLIEELLEQTACQIVSTQAEVSQLLERLHKSPQDIKAGGLRARQVWQRQQGACNRISNAIFSALRAGE